jgi:hypothetical protein
VNQSLRHKEALPGSRFFLSRMERATGFEPATFSLGS